MINEKSDLQNFHVETQDHSRQTRSVVVRFQLPERIVLTGLRLNRRCWVVNYNHKLRCYSVQPQANRGPGYWISGPAVARFQTKRERRLWRRAAFAMKDRRLQNTSNGPVSRFLQNIRTP